jgi:hypothetical protein
MNTGGPWNGFAISINTSNELRCRCNSHSLATREASRNRGNFMQYSTQSIFAPGQAIKCVSAECRINYYLNGILAAAADDNAAAASAGYGRINGNEQQQQQQLTSKALTYRRSWSVVNPFLMLLSTVSAFLVSAVRDSIDMAERMKAFNAHRCVVVH